ncbi:serine hydrolase domain-containing protein, partial [Winogradskyella poriferorum]|uniref:serine hydrolase domain-containing protein n=1 Tax=Winogradskyella poriferorum TaxID=307627 RepID=UPI003D648800
HPLQKTLYFTLFFIFSVQAQERLNDNALFNRIDSYLIQSVANGYSGSVLVAQDGQIILSKGYGWADRSNKIKNTPSTVFNIGSVTKQFTAAAILKLMEEEKLDVTDKIETY